MMRFLKIFVFLLVVVGDVMVCVFVKFLIDEFVAGRI